ncbi:GNAT family N-acetyltransferase [Labilibaculum sp. 44]|uniref:GNAT family N-acetyltransferase n=2 Tax=Labilibaculum euxinus TaxID=2686357 RepID=A0A7M4D3F6_9BACT|nr:GNAT family N-acetyltransferase [Labilibaculum euxinus]MVB06390.1 GNAT family N-acetyltransferase [Labilibaculum euxinus]
MMSSIKLRNYKSDDYQSVLKLWKITNLGGEERGDNAETIETSLLHGGKFWILEDSKTRKLIGSCWVTNDSRRLYLHHVGIHPEYQLHGYGKFLTETALAHAKSLNMQIKLEVHHSNKTALNIYKKLGFNILEGYEVMIKRRH